jgi:hypothetical protein
MTQRHWFLAAALSTGLASCSQPNSDSNPGDTGSLQIALTSAPADVACLKIAVAGSRSTTKAIDLTAAAPTTYTFKGLPVGIATVSAEAFAGACAGLGTDAVPSYLTEAPVSVRIDPVDLAKVVVKLIRNGRLSVDVDFENGVQPYLVPTAPGVITKALFTAGDSVNTKPDGTPYRMVGIPDGLGAFDNGDGTFTVLMNHEISTGGIVRAHGARGAFVSKWTIRKSDLTVTKGEDLIKQVVLWDPLASAYKAPASGVAFSRFCSADLPARSALFDAASGLGYDGALFMDGEEAGNEGRAMAHALDGTSYELPRLGKMSFENSVANPKAAAFTIVALTDDGGPAQVYVYVGTKTNAGSPVDKAGLTNGKLYGVKVTGFTSEPPAAGIPAGTAFTLVDLGNVENKTGVALDADSVAAGVTSFQRPEDSAWDPSNPSDLYFVTTASFTGFSRLWRLHFTDLGNPAAGGTIDMLLDGTEGQKMFDNLTVNKKGQVTLQEDVGNQDHLGKVWRYDIATDKLTQVAQHNPFYFAPGAPQFLTRDEESSGVIDVSDILGPGWYLMDVQAHYATDVELVEGGQLLAVFDPAAK